MSIYSNNPRPLGAVLREAIESLGFRARIDAARAVELWPEIAGPTIAQATESAWMRDRRLFVKIRSAAWRHQLHLQREQWRDRINKHIGGDVVEEVVFR